MLQFADSPYRYTPPKLNRLFLAILKQSNRAFILRSVANRIRGITVLNMEAFTAARERAGGRILFLPNHPTHSDPWVMLELQRRCDANSLFMTAYDVFTRGRVRAWVVQHGGGFSVDRDASDSLAMKEAIGTMAAGRYMLTIFPEGNVFFNNDRVTPFLEGAAFMAMKAQKRVGTRETVAVLPVAMKYTCLNDETRTVRRMIKEAGVSLGLELKDNIDLLAKMRRIGITFLSQKLGERGFLTRPPEAELPTMLRNTAISITGRLEERMALSPGTGDSLIDRLRKIRRAIHVIRIDAAKEAEHSEVSEWADEAILVFRILSYSGEYVAENPTVDRFAETAVKLLEDLNSNARLPGWDRHVFVRFGEPVFLTDHLGAFGQKAREAVTHLTTSFETSVQQALDRINADNPHPGGQLFDT
ncbi:MAG TPA: 1-acyl-sn-glycerol-3-phosphate acyltransferase [Verrucomicrobiales bacterium]|nr:1-acyl-sn-glycerol-3-phosphate acyltransferase [Verrucomicrobiales bacterium]